MGCLAVSLYHQCGLFGCQWLSVPSVWAVWLSLCAISVGCLAVSGCLFVPSVWAVWLSVAGCTVWAVWLSVAVSLYHQFGLFGCQWLAVPSVWAVWLSVAVSLYHQCGLFGCQWLSLCTISVGCLAVSGCLFVPSVWAVWLSVAGCTISVGCLAVSGCLFVPSVWAVWLSVAGCTISVGCLAVSGCLFVPSVWAVWLSAAVSLFHNCGSLDCQIPSLAKCLRRLPSEQLMGFHCHLHCGDFSRSSHTSDLNLALKWLTLPGAWCYRINTGTGWPGVSILQLREAESLICNFYLSVAARKLV